MNGTKFMLEFKDYLDWDKVPVYQFLPEKLIKKLEDYVNWELVSRWQLLSDEFIIENPNKEEEKIINLL